MLRLFTENLTLKLISLAFAVVLWFFVMGERRHEVSHLVPVTYRGVPEGLIIANEVPGAVEVSISGPRALLSHLDTGDLEVVVNLAQARAGTTSFKHLGENLRTPAGLTVTRVYPASLEVRLERLRDRQVPVRVVLHGAPAAGFEVRAVRSEPHHVLVSGAESALKTIEEAATEEIDINGRRESFSQKATILFNQPFTLLKGPRTITIKVEVAPAGRRSAEKKR